MTRESKLALIIGFVLILVVGVLVSDHLSQASSDTIDPNTGIERAQPIAELPTGQHERAVIENAIKPEPPSAVAERNPLVIDEPIVISQAPREDSLFDRVRESVGSLSENGAPTLAAHSQPAPTPTYTVRSNDSLYAIARSLLGDGERWREIHTLNAKQLGPDPVLQPGMVLRLPADARGGAQRTARSEPDRDTPRLGITPTTYEVQPGDVLGMISQRLLGTSKRAREIADLNGLEDLDDIRIGMVLKIPAR